MCIKKRSDQKNNETAAEGAAVYRTLTCVGLSLVKLLQSLRVIISLCQLFKPNILQNCKIIVDFSHLLLCCKARSKFIQLVHQGGRPLQHPSRAGHGQSSVSTTSHLKAKGKV